MPGCHPVDTEDRVTARRRGDHCQHHQLVERLRQTGLRQKWIVASAAEGRAPIRTKPFVAPAQRHAAADALILEKRKQLYELARQKHPARWSGQLRKWQPVGSVWLNLRTDHEMRNTQHELEAA